MVSSSKMAYMIAEAAENKKGIDVRILNISYLSPLTDYFVIVSGSSTNQVQAISDEIEEKLSEAGVFLSHKEGYNSGRWILMDYGNVITHIFHEEERSFYDIERLWADAETIQL